VVRGSLRSSRTPTRRAMQMSEEPDRGFGSSGEISVPDPPTPSDAVAAVPRADAVVTSRHGQVGE
jgi:hypothetical protein